MPVKEFTADLAFIQRSMRRIVLNGPPNSRKTSSTHTIPGNVFIQVYPGEKGYTSAPWSNFEGKKIRTFVSDPVDFDKPQNWNELLKEQIVLTVDIITGKYGPCDAFCGDGLHKFYQLYLAAQCNGDNYNGWAKTTENTSDKKGDGVGRIYGAAHGPFSKYLEMVFNSPARWVVLMLWDGSEKENDLSNDPKAIKKKYPDLPGKMAKHILGETSVVLHADHDGHGAAARYFWRTEAGGDVSGAGMKLAVDIRKRINLPREVDQDFNKLDKLVMTQVEKVWNELNPTKEVV